MSIQAAATWLLENQPWDFFAVYYDAIDHFCHGFMRYHPPRQSWIGERDFELYHNVVSMAYQFHDQMLGTLLEKAGAGYDGHSACRITASIRIICVPRPFPISRPGLPSSTAISASWPSAGRA